MTLTLDYTQRLNLVAMLDACEAQGRREAWAVCALQSRIDLNDQERDAIGYRRMKTPDGRDYAQWAGANGNAPLPLTVELDEPDTRRICRAVDNYRVIWVRDRAWYEPLVAQLPPPEDLNAAVR
jgi:hypothetical protein